MKLAAYALLVLAAATGSSPRGPGAAAGPEYAIAQTGEQTMPSGGEQDRTKGPASGSKDDVVITPAGPMPKDKVREVKPGEAVRQNEDGTVTIVPDSTKK